MTRRLVPPALLLMAVLMGGSVAAADDQRAAQLADFAVVRSDYLAKDKALDPAARAAAEARLQALEAQAGTLTQAELLVGLGRIAALADNAHTGVRFYAAEARPKGRLPLRLLWIGDEIVVARAGGDQADLAGARVLAIEGLKPKALYAATRDVLGGKMVDRKARLPEWIELQGVLHAMGVARAADALDFDLRLADGRRVSRRIAMAPTGRLTPTAEFSRLWSPEPLPAETGWRAAPTGALPLYQRDADRAFRLVDLPRLDAAYLQLRSNEDEGAEQIAPFLTQSRKRLEAARPRYLIVDLRFDIGGNMLTTLEFMRAAPALARDHVFLLVGPYTYSAGIVSAAVVEKAGGARVTIVGDEVGDRMRFWSEGANAKLPNSHLALRYTDGIFDLAHGCGENPACMNQYIQADPVSLAPDVAAPLTLKAWLSGRDPAMEAVERLIRERG